MTRSIGRSTGINQFRTPRVDYPQDIPLLLEQGRYDDVHRQFRTCDLRYRRLKCYERDNTHAGDHLFPHSYGGRTQEEYFEMWKRIKNPWAYDAVKADQYLADQGARPMNYSDEWSPDNFHIFSAPYAPIPQLVITPDRLSQATIFASNQDRYKEHRGRCAQMCRHSEESYREMLDYYREGGIPLGELYIHRNRIYVSDQWFQYLERKHKHFHPEDYELLL